MTIFMLFQTCYCKVCAHERSLEGVQLESNVCVAIGDKAYIGEDDLQHKTPLPLTQVLRFTTRVRRYHNVYGCYHTKKDILDTTNQDDDNTAFGLHHFGPIECYANVSYLVVSAK